MISDNNELFMVDETSDLPIWVQLRNRFAYLIKTGHFQPGDQLPSVRSLAAEARINYNTVTKAYRDLELEGLILNVRGRGMFVQKTSGAEEAAVVAADAAFEECVRKYRALGMTYDDIQSRTSNAIFEMKSKANADAGRRVG